MSSEKEEKSSDEEDFNYQPSAAEIKESEIEKANLEAQINANNEQNSNDGLVKADENVKSKGQSLWEKLKSEKPQPFHFKQPNNDEIEDENSKRAGKTPTQRGVRSSDLNVLLNELSSNKKLNSIGKSKLRWDIFKTQKGISRQLDLKSSNGFLSKQNFLYNSKPTPKKDP